MMFHYVLRVFHDVLLVVCDVLLLVHDVLLVIHDVGNNSYRDRCSLSQIFLNFF